MSQTRFVHDMMNHLGVVVGYSNLLLEELPEEDPRKIDIDEIRKAGQAAIALIERWSAETRGEEAT